MSKKRGPDRIHRMDKITRQETETSGEISMLSPDFLSMLSPDFPIDKIT